MNQFDINKFKTLVKVYQAASDQRRETACIGRLGALYL